MFTDTLTVSVARPISTARSASIPIPGGDGQSFAAVQLGLKAAWPTCSSRLAGLKLGYPEWTTGVGYPPQQICVTSNSSLPICRHRRPRTIYRWVSHGRAVAAIAGAGSMKTGGVLVSHGPIQCKWKFSSLCAHRTWAAAENRSIRFVLTTRADKAVNVAAADHRRRSTLSLVASLSGW